MEGLSPIISVTVLIVIAISIASFVAPWMYDLVTTTTNQTGSTANMQVKCRSAGLDFDSTYGDYGVSYNFSANITAGESDWIRVKVVNTGSVDLYGFTIEATIENNSVQEIQHYDLTSATQKTADNPLRPSRSEILVANITSDIEGSTATLTEIAVLNSACTWVSPSIEL